MMKHWMRRSHYVDGVYIQKQINKTEICISCKNDTGVPIGLDIESRLYYIQGAGQLCQDCYNTLYPKE